MKVFYYYPFQGQDVVAWFGPLCDLRKRSTAEFLFLALVKEGKVLFSTGKLLFLEQNGLAGIYETSLLIFGLRVAV